MIFSGLALRNHRRRIFVLVTAALNLPAVPYGTILSIFTFAVLQRPAAKEIFGQSAVALSQPPLAS